MLFILLFTQLSIASFDATPATSPKAIQNPPGPASDTPFTENGNDPTTTGMLKGFVSSDRNDALPFAHIYLPEHNRGAITHRDGTFEISRLPFGEHRLLVSHVGFSTFETTVEITGEEPLRIHITLQASHEMPAIELIGKSPDRMARIPGSVAVVNAERLKVTQPVNSAEVFREIPGINMISHDGIGLRTNIGIRGLDPDMSRNVLILEDGIPVALAPYGEPEMYYSPAISRMRGIEVIKGSGSILFGPRTIGGVINYLTNDPPSEREFQLYVNGSTSSYLTSRMQYGDTAEKSGFLVTWLRSQGHQFGPLDFRLNDITTKWKLTLTDQSVLGIKMGVYDESSNATYVGLTQPMFDSGRFDHTTLAPDDNLHVRRYSFSATHQHFFTPQVHVRTSVFAYTTQRNWSRQDFDNNPVDGREYHRIIGNPDELYGAIYFRSTTGNRNREFEVAGLEPRFSARYYLGSFQNELDAGLRYLYERAYEKRINGSISSPATGDLRDDEIRTGHAFSAFVQNRFFASSKLHITSGIRVEHFLYEREILRLSFSDESKSSQDGVTGVIPGIGINYQFGPQSVVFAGIHRGFSPPRIKDAITSTGSSQELDTEWSWSYEAGFRIQPHSFIRTSVTSYIMNFENQIIPVSESAGGQGIPGATGLTNGGATFHHGLEFSLELSPPAFAGNRMMLSLELNGTWSQARFKEDRFVRSGSEIVNIKNNELPYAPNWSGYSRISVRHDAGFSGYLKGIYTGSQFGDVLNLKASSGNGRDGRLDAYTVVDAGLRYHLPLARDISLSGSVKNLTDARYITSRRPQGIRVGLPRMFFLSAEMSF